MKSLGHPMLTSKTLVSELLENLPEAARLWIKLHANCIGCSMNRFCTIEDLCRYYELDLHHILSLIQENKESIEF